MNSNGKNYTVKHIHDELVTTGKGDSPFWKNAVVLTDFHYPWEKEEAPLTTFRALHSKDWLYLLYVVKDDNVNVYVHKKDKTDALNSDRVEIFLRQDEKMVPYYGLEMDPMGRVYDYRAEYFRKVDGDWNWPAGQLIIKTSRTAEGYVVEVAISKASLNQFGLINGKAIQAGLFRGNCVKLVGDQADIKWISWVKPDSPTPDFHVPSAFGLLTLEE